MSRGPKERREKGAARRPAIDWVALDSHCGDCQWHYCEAAEREHEERPHCFGDDDAIDPARLARAYARNGAATAEFPDGTKWASDCVWNMQLDHPEPALEVIRLAAEDATTDWERCMIGCGNLESLLGNHGSKVIGAIERYARESAAFRECLSHVWQHGMPDDVWLRVLKASDREPA